MSFKSYNRFYYWGNTCRRNNIYVDSTKKRVLEFLHILMHVCRSLHRCLKFYFIFNGVVYLPVMTFPKLWSVTIAEMLPVGRETLHTHETQTIGEEFKHSRLIHVYRLIFIVRVVLCIFGMCFCSVLKYYFFICNFYNAESRLLTDSLLMISIRFHNIFVPTIEYKEIAFLRFHNITVSIIEYKGIAEQADPLN